LVKPEAPPENSATALSRIVNDATCCVFRYGFCLIVGQNPKAKAAQFKYEIEILERGC